MQGTNRIYEEPTLLARALVVGLSVAVVLMAGWLAATIIVAQPSTISEGSSTAVPSLADEPVKTSDTPRQTARSVHFDWPAEFASTSAPPPARAALPLAAEAPAASTLAPGPWPVAAPDGGNRGLPLSAGAATEASDAIMDVLTPPPPPPPSRAGAGREPAPAAPQRQAHRRQKPRVDGAIAPVMQ